MKEIDIRRIDDSMLLKLRQDCMTMAMRDYAPTFHSNTAGYPSALNNNYVPTMETLTTRANQYYAWITQNQ